MYLSNWHYHNVSIRCRYIIYSIFMIHNDLLTTEICNYIRTSVTRTPIARLPRLFRTRSKGPFAVDIIIVGVISEDFLFYTDKGMLCVLSRITSMRRF